jgi:hypothetical protein
MNLHGTENEENKGEASDVETSKELHYVILDYVTICEFKKKNI